MDRIEVGQIWEAQADGDTPPILCFVGKIDVFRAEAEDMRVVSLAIVPHPVARNIGWPIVDHIPLQETAFREAGLKFVKDGAQIGDRFQSGYTLWREKLDVGKASAFHSTPSAAYAGTVSAARQAMAE